MDQYHQGDTVLVARTGKPTCPVNMVEQYMTRAELVGKFGLLFQPLTSDGKRLHASGSLTYSHLRELLLGRLQALGYPSDQFGIHSLRAGGAMAAAGSGVLDRLFKRHRHWRSDTAKDRYTCGGFSARPVVFFSPLLCIPRVYMCQLVNDE